MTFYSSDRGISPVLGGILMFGLAMSLLILTQVSVVPAANTQVEFEHNQRVQDDFERFQASSSRVASSGAPETVDVEVGVRYPNRLFLLNPSPVSGQLTTEDVTIDIANVRAINPETNDYFTITKANTFNYDTKRLLYEPNYNEYSNAPRTAFENGVTFNEFDGDVTLVRSTTPLINDGDITLILLDGDVHEQGTSSASLSLQAASAPSKRIAITNTSTGRIEITLQTRLPKSEWQAFNDSTPAVTGVTFSGDTVTLTLDPSRDYTLRVARLTIGDDAVPGTAAYVTSVGEQASSIPSNSAITYTVEVRDAQNNPVSGSEVVATLTGNATFSNTAKTQTVSVDEDGRASVAVTGQQNKRGVVDVTIGRDSTGTNGLTDEPAEQLVNYTVTLAPTAITEIDQVVDVGSVLNPGTDGDLRLLAVSGDSIQFENLATTNRTIEEVRISFVKADGQGNASVIDVDSVVLEGVNVHPTSTGGTYNQNYVSTTFTVGDDYKGLDGGDIVIPGKHYVTLDLDFVGTKNGDLQPGDFYIVSVRFDGAPSATYFVGVVS